jgi:hypothetical protein
MSTALTLTQGSRQDRDYLAKPSSYHLSLKNYRYDLNIKTGWGLIKGKAYRTLTGWRPRRRA